MAVDPVVQVFIARSMAENNRSLMSEISTLITNTVGSIMRSNSEAVDDQLREIKKIRREEPKSFIGAPKFILGIISEYGYKIPFITTPPPVHLKNNGSAL